ncbi:hypothetical protein GP486_003001 [Trichoglossum hirsutum]|uniref:Uncharacterized protein n=1 Tax=Trichoglossum hirsutum TaxID=265104 RepID=A0A9P8LDQ5_9PEZI|nr:hypothetical protein GP486_003001 [Trichoglossum hirsutum]
MSEPAPPKNFDQPRQRVQANMPEQETSDEYGTSKAIPSEMADAARQEILDSIAASDPDLLTREFDHPLNYRPYTAKTREAAKELVENADKDILANLTGIPAGDIADRFNKAFPVLFVKTTVSPYHMRGGRPNRVWTFIAFGRLTFEIGLPAPSSTRFDLTLESGDALHIRGDVDMWFSGGGGGTALLADWKVY